MTTSGSSEQAGGGTTARDEDPSGLAVKTTEVEQQPPGCKKKKVLTLFPLIFLIYFEVSGGPYGEEPAVQAAGPLLALIGFLIFPFIWSIPEALITAELATAYPGNGGYVVWATEAFGPFCGHLMGSWKFLSGVINNAAYPVLCADYLARAIPSLDASNPHHAVRDAAIAGFTLSLSFLNYLGLAVVGYGGVALGAVSLMPFFIMGGYAIPKLRPHRWLSVSGRPKKKADWSLYFNTLFWNLNYWDNASTLAGEVKNPQRTFPKALLAAGVITCVGYLVPLFAATGALDVPQELWEDGFLADAAGMLGGKWLKYWVQAGSVMSAVGLYEAQLSTCAYQLLGMSQLGIFPKIFSSRSKWFNTPWLGILVSTAITLAISFLDFTDIVSAANFVYGLSMLLEFAAFIHLRRKHPGLVRPYRVPLGVPGLIVMCIVPSGFLVFIMAIGTWKVYAIGAGLTALGVAAYFGTGVCKEKKWMEFVDEPTVEGIDDVKWGLPK